VSAQNIGQEVIRHGYDALDLAFAGTISREATGALQDAKRQAQEAQEPEPVRFGGVMGLVYPAGVRGAQYRLDTGADRENWFIATGGSARDWNIRVSVRAQSLAAYGLHDSYRRVLDTAGELGARITDERVSRIDYAVDIKAQDFELDPRRFVMPTGGGLQAYDFREDGGEESIDVFYYDHKPNSIRIGQVTNRQVAVYDKRREISVRRHNAWWWDIWGLDPTDPENEIWRVEIRAARGYMRKFGIMDFADVAHAAGDVFNHAVERVRYVDDGVRPHRQRPTDPFWTLAQHAIRSGLNEASCGLEPADIVRGERDAMRAMLSKQLTGIAMAHACTNEVYTFNDFRQTAGLHYGSTVEEAIERNPKDAEKRFDRAWKRYAILYRR